MDKPMLESRLKLYKQHKAEVVTTLQRIAVWEESLSKGELWLFENSVSRMLGMPRPPGVHSPTEKSVEQREITAELVREWIEEDKSRMYYKKLETDQIDEALKALTTEQRTVIEAKYFEEMTWKNIEILFNEKHSKGRVFIQTDGIRKINSEALEILWKILGPLLQKYLYFRQAE